VPEKPSREAVLKILAEKLSDTLLEKIFPGTDPTTVRRLIHPSAMTARAGDPASVATGSGKTRPGSCRLYTDGASRGNPGEAGAGILLLDHRERELATRSVYLGVCTNNVAEYQALLHGLQLARELGCRRLEIFLDSELIVRQLQGRYQVKSPALKPLYTRVGNLLGQFAQWRISHVPRSDNSRADALANRAIDEKRG